MHLTPLDWAIVAASLLVCFAPAFFFARRSGKSTSEFFASGRSVPWWLAGLSMVATTFSSDTPNLVTNIVRTQGVAGNWQWWAFTLTGIATVFFYARLWRRSGVLTDLEFYELRYSGKAASIVRGFRAVYLGLFFNCIIIGTVNLAGCKIANVLFGIPVWKTLLFIGVVNVAFAAHSGLWGVLVIDMIQFFVKMSAVIAAAYFALRAPGVGGLSGMVEKISAMKGPDDHPGLHYLSMLPDFTSARDLAIAVFVLPLAVQWWSTWYPGSEPGGGSYIAQRMLASRSEKDALGAVLFFNLAHYILRPWPWIIVGLCSLIVFPTLPDIKAAFPNADEHLIGHDSGFPAMLKFLPSGWMGLMVGGLIAASSSTILTHLNWGSSYVVHDFYRRFVKPDAPEKHYVNVGRLTTVAIFVIGAGVTLVLNNASNAFEIILLVGSGTGLLYLARWFWWRVNAWSEIVAMASSFAVSLAILAWDRTHERGQIPGQTATLLTIGVTTACWLAAAFLAPQTSEETLLAFYRKVRPAGPGWARVRAQLGLTSRQVEAETGDNITLSLVGWLAGTALIWSALFTVGNVLYGRWGYAAEMGAVAAVSGVTTLFVARKAWRSAKVAAPLDTPVPEPVVARPND